MYNHQLDTFLKVADKGSFSKAAEDLYISPTAVIKQINLLELSIGAVLFNRSHRGLTLTTAGESLRKDAKRIIRLCNDAQERACQADQATRCLIRVGFSPMTPNGFITDLWGAVSSRCPLATIKLVPFENTLENACDILANLGENIDVVGGLYDEAFLESCKCAALPLARMPLRLAVPSSNSLRDREVISLDDLVGQKVFIIQRGWNENFDALRDYLISSVNDIEIEEFSFFDVGTFNHCEEEGCLLVSCDLWKDVHPLLVTKPVDWDFAAQYGILHAPEPSASIQALLDIVADEVASRE